MELICKINYKDDSETLLVKNFYQVIFIESDFKTVIIYTAIVYCNYSGTIKNNKTLEIQFSFDGLSIKKCELSNFGLDQEKKTPLQRVWGDFTGLICEPEDLEKAYSELSVKSKNKQQIPQLLKDELENKRVYRIGMKGMDKGVSCVAVLQNGMISDDKLLIWYGKSNLPENISIMNLSKAKLYFENPLNKNLKYSLRQTSGNNFLFTDFSLYVIPPLIFEIDTNHSKLELDNNKTKASIEEKDSISLVGKNIDAYFHEWELLDILSRNVYRITSSTVKNVTELNKYNLLNIEFKLHSSSLDYIFQVFIGVYISFILAFVVDKTRLKDVEEYFFFKDYIPLDIFCIIICITIFALYIINILNISRNRECKYGGLIKTIICISASIFFVLYFWIFQINKNKPWIYWTSLIGLIPILGLIGLLFLIYIKKGYKSCYNFKLLKAFFKK